MSKINDNKISINFPIENLVKHQLKFIWNKYEMLIGDIVIDRAQSYNLNSYDNWYGEIKDNIEKEIVIIHVENNTDLSEYIVVNEE